MLYYIGADPGTPLSLAMVSGDGRMVAHATDKHFVRDRMNNAELLATVMKSWSGFQLSKGHTVKVIVEHVGIRPNENLVHAVPFVGSMYLVEGVAAALGLPCMRVHPSRWKRHMKLTANKKLSLQRARELFPDKAMHLRKARDHNVAEAALLALYGVQTDSVTGV